MCHCLNCGKQFKTIRNPATVYACSEACRKEFNNRRMVRGAVLGDFVMSMRFDRANSKGLWTTLCALAREFREEDVQQRNGRRSWQKPEAIKAARPSLVSKVTRIGK